MVTVSKLQMKKITSILSKGIILTWLWVLALYGYGQTINYSVYIKESSIDMPVSVSLDDLPGHALHDTFSLYEITKSGEKPIHSQIETGYIPRLWFVLEGYSAENSIRKFVLKFQSTESTKSPGTDIRINKSADKLTLRQNGQPVLSYQFGTMYPPEGVSPLFKRSGFIHPLWSPKGEILTRVQAPDHYHHYGIWGPWTLTHIGDRKVDFWNLNDGDGTVEFAGFLSETEGDLFSGFSALQQHIDFGAKGEDQVAINEILDVRVWHVNDKVSVIDYTTLLNTPLTNGILFDAYRYGGGIGFRATEKWTKENCTVLTSEGKTRVDADGSNARWCIVEGASDTEDGRSGILFLSHPANRAHPEPMRVWPMDANGGRGDMFFEFTPIRHQSWELQKGQNYVLKYRMVVFDGAIDKETAEMYWNSFAVTPEIVKNEKLKMKN